MKKPLIWSIALLAGSLLAAPAYGEDKTPCVPASSATPQNTCVTMHLDATSGVWFSLSRAVDVLALAASATDSKAALAERDAQVDAQAKALEERRAEAESLKTVVSVDDKRVQAAEERADRAEADARKWYKSPLLWASLGATAGAMAGCKLAGGGTLPCIAIPGGGGAALVTVVLLTR